MNWFLLIAIIVMVFALLAVNIYVLVYFQHPDDKNTAYLPKVLVVFGLLFAEASVLLLPLDVANNTTAVGCSAGWNDSCGGLKMDIFWLIIFMGIAVFIILLLPYTIYYYEADDGDGNKNQSQMCEAMKLEILTVVMSAIVLVIMFTTLAESEIPIKTISQPSSVVSGIGGFNKYTDGNTLSTAEVAYARSLKRSDYDVKMKISFTIYTTALIGFVGWFAFSVFVGIGLVALPMDLILFIYIDLLYITLIYMNTTFRAYVNRPKFIPADLYAGQKISIQNRTQELIKLGKTIKQGFEKSSDINKQSLWQKRKQRKVDKITMNKFKQSVFILERDVEDLKLCHNEYKQYNPLIPIGKLMFGCIGCLISLIWVVQIAVYMVPPIPITGFLNDYFLWFDKWFPLFGTITVGIFAMYLLACAVKGCFKFGLRCFCFSLHPMKMSGTYMNSFLFNLGLILICCIPLVQFCDQAFSDYARLTGIQTIMGSQIRYLRFFKFFWVYNIFIYSILGVAFITLLYLLFSPTDSASPIDEIHERIQKQIKKSKA